MTLRVAVVDDEPLARSGVIALLREHDDLAVVAEYGDGRSALAALQADGFDMVFMDVQMPGMSGIEVLAALPSGQRPITVLITAHDSFAVRAFELGVVDYLLKPVHDDRFDDALRRARQAYANRDPGSLASSPGQAEKTCHLKRFSVRVGRRTVIVDAAAVEWIDADGDYATLHVGAKTYLVRESLRRLSALLDPAAFIRVHRSAIVRVDCVVELQPLSNRDAMVRLRDGTHLRASRTYIDSLLSLLGGPYAPSS